MKYFLIGLLTIVFSFLSSDQILANGPFYDQYSLIPYYDDTATVCAPVSGSVSPNPAPVGTPIAFSSSNIGEASTYIYDEWGAGADAPSPTDGIWPTRRSTTRQSGSYIWNHSWRTCKETVMDENNTIIEYRGCSVTRCPVNSSGVHAPLAIPYSVTGLNGQTDIACTTGVTGWYCDAANYNTATPVHVWEADAAGNVNFSDSSKFLGAAAAVPSPESVSQCGNVTEPAHGFALPIPSSLKNSQTHYLNVYVQDLVGTWNRVKTAFPISCANTATPPPSLPPGEPGLGALQINANSNEGAVGTSPALYQLSGLRADETNPADRGSSYFNSLTVAQRISGVADSSNVSLVGAAFTSMASAPITCLGAVGQGCLASLVSSAHSDNGVVLIYAYKNTTAAGQPFLEGNYYFYHQNGGWKQVTGTYIPSSGNEINVKTGPNTNPLTLAPQFSVRMQKTLGSQTWGTYGYVMNGSGKETSTAIAPTQL